MQRKTIVALKKKRKLKKIDQDIFKLFQFTSVDEVTIKPCS